MFDALLNNLASILSVISVLCAFTGDNPTSVDIGIRIRVITHGDTKTTEASNCNRRKNYGTSCALWCFCVSFDASGFVFPDYCYSSEWPCSPPTIFRLLLATKETAFIHAISAAAITYELTLKCRHNIRGCKCKRRKLPHTWEKNGRTLNGCGDNVEFGEYETRRFFENLEKGNDARTAVNLHNNKVGREVTIVTEHRGSSLNLISSEATR